MGRTPVDLTEPREAGSLLEQIARGHVPALEAFYAAFHAPVYAFALKRLRNAADAADVLNEVLLEVWRSAARFEGRSRPLTWVLGIAHHKIIDHLRRRREHLEETLPPDLPDPEPADATVALAHAGDAEMVRRCLERLSDVQRLVVHLAFYEDLSYPEIAEIAGCPIGTVKTRMLHAKQLLRRCLGTDATTSAAAAGFIEPRGAEPRPTSVARNEHTTDE
jgi:RNA polymerase sigma-70 factor (ECF subfamily)